MISFAKFDVIGADFHFNWIFLFILSHNYVGFTHCLFAFSTDLRDFLQFRFCETS